MRLAVGEPLPPTGLTDTDSVRARHRSPQRQPSGDESNANVFGQHEHEPNAQATPSKFTK